MTDKELIKQEIERRRKQLPKETEHKGLMAVYGGIAYELTELLQFIDSLPEESASEDLEEEISNYIKDNFFGSGSMGFLSNRTKGELDSVDVANIARHFAELGRKHK